MKLGKRWLLWAYRMEPPRVVFDYGADREIDPDTFTVWIYLGWLGLAVSWSADGWLHPGEGTAARACEFGGTVTPAYADAWDELSARERASRGI